MEKVWENKICFKKRRESYFVVHIILSLFLSKFPRANEFVPGRSWSLSFFKHFFTKLTASTLILKNVDRILIIIRLLLYMYMIKHNMIEFVVTGSQ